MKLKFLAIFLGIFLFIALGLVLFLKTAVYDFTFQNKVNLVYKNKNSLLQPKICEPRVWEINLSKNQIYFYENCKLKKIIPIAYQAPEGKWYQTPTSYFRIGVKKEKHISSLLPVYMNYAVQMYEDFFIHEIPYYLDGIRVDTNFTGGCIRLEPQYAKEFFELAKTGDFVISYKDLDDIKINDNFVFPVNKNEYFIRQRFNNPIRTSYTYSQDRWIDYSQHAGIDLAPFPNAKDLNVYNIYDGKVAKIVKNGKGDHGMGNTVIVEHSLTRINTDLDTDIHGFGIDTPKSSGASEMTTNTIRVNPRALNHHGTGRANPRQSVFYSLYAHLDSINPSLTEGQMIQKGEIIGRVGATGYGCNYWRIGEDGCDKKTKLDTHLHFEIKTKPVLESPVEATCHIEGREVKCYGYTPDDPKKFGYFDPIEFLAF